MIFKLRIKLVKRFAPYSGIPLLKERGERTLRQAPVPPLTGHGQNQTSCPHCKLRKSFLMSAQAEEPSARRRSSFADSV